MSTTSSRTPSPTTKSSQLHSQTRRSPISQPNRASPTTLPPGSPLSSPPSVPSISTSPGPPRAPPYRAPRSGDLAYIGSLPTPTVQPVVNQRYPQHSPGEASNHPNSQTTPINSKDPDMPAVSQPMQGETKMPNQQTPSLLPPNAILSSASRDWEGVTSQGVKVQRRDTWAVGQGWGRHMRVYDTSSGNRRAASTGMAVGRVERGQGEGGRHRSC